MNRLVVVTLVNGNVDEFAFTLKSVRSQFSLPDSHLVLDSSPCQSAATVKRLCRANGASYHWREPEGVYPAMREALELAGESGYVMFLNSGDYFADENAAKSILEILGQEPGVYWVIGGIKLVGKEGALGFYRVPSDPREFGEALRKGNIWLPHPSTVYRIDALKSVSPFSDRLRISSDYATGLRMFDAFGPPTVLEASLSCHTLGGLSTTSGPLPALENSLARLRMFGVSLLGQELLHIVRILGGYIGLALRAWFSNR